MRILQLFERRTWQNIINPGITGAGPNREDIIEREGVYNIPGGFGVHPSATSEETLERFPNGMKECNEPWYHLVFV